MLEGETLLDLLNKGPFITSCHRKATIAHLPPAVTGRSYVISPLHANRMNCTCTTLMQSKTSELNSPSLSLSLSLFLSKKTLFY